VGGDQEPISLRFGYLGLGGIQAGRDIAGRKEEFMKHMPLVLVLAALLLAIAASGVESRAPYVGVFADTYHASTCVFMPTGSTSLPFTLWVWSYPGDQGLMATEFTLELPSNVTLVGSEMNFGVCAPVVGCYWPCLCCPYQACQTDWHWSWKIDCVLIDSNPSLIRIKSCGTDPMIQAPNCSIGYPVEQVTVLNDFGLNQLIATEPVSWGAIRSLYR